MGEGSVMGWGGQLDSLTNIGADTSHPSHLVLTPMVPGTSKTHSRPGSSITHRFNHTKLK
uniref:Uncharacterized protein n=1 Tax=Anguilla anguilla TaxID=7936 RepID=A0A0E9XRJ6_ANGAN